MILSKFFYRFIIKKELSSLIIFLFFILLSVSNSSGMEYSLSVMLNSPELNMISSDPEGISCKTKCEARYEEGTNVRLKILPEYKDAYNIYWSGNVCNGIIGECIVNMNDNISLSADMISWNQPPGMPDGTVNYVSGKLDDISKIYDNNVESSTEFDEVQEHIAFPYSYFLVNFNTVNEIFGIKFLNNTKEYNHITNFKIMILQTGGDVKKESDWIEIIPEQESSVSFGWQKVLFSDKIETKCVKVIYTSIIGNYAAPVNEVYFLTNSRFLESFPSELTFENIEVNTSSRPQSLSIINSINSNIYFGETYITGDSFTIVSNECNNSINQLSSCKIDVTFKPNVLGESTATLVIPFLNSKPILSINLRGRGTAPSQHPFPQNMIYHYGNMPEDTSYIDARDIYHYGKEKFVTSEGAGGYKRIQIFDNDTCTFNNFVYSKCTVSEGIGYWMLLAVNYNDKLLFDDLLNYYKQYQNENGLMMWFIDKEGAPLDTGAATDADQDIAFAIVLASIQWGNKGQYNYEEEAKQLINNIYQFEVDPNTFILKPGDKWNENSKINPSYFAPAYHRIFKLFVNEQGWDEVIKKEYEILELVQNKETGLVPDWCYSDGSLISNENYGYDAVRTPWRIVIDYLWFGNEKAYEFCNLITQFSSSKDEVLDGYYLNGEPYSDYKNSAFIGTFAVAGMATNSHDYINQSYRNNVNHDSVEYFGTSIKALTIFLQSGNFFNPEPDIKANNNLFTLTLNKLGNGHGSIISIPEGISCGFSCVYDFEANTEIKLQYTPHGNSGFLGWNLDECNNDLECLIQMDSHKTIHATIIEWLTPKQSVFSGSRFNYVPLTEDQIITANLTFSIENKPDWTSFDSTTGMLSGQPSYKDIGTTHNIVISANNGKFTTRMNPFDLSVFYPPAIDFFNLEEGAILTNGPVLDYNCSGLTDITIYIDGKEPENKNMITLIDKIMIHDLELYTEDGSYVNELLIYDNGRTLINIKDLMEGEHQFIVSGVDADGHIFQKKINVNKTSESPEFFTLGSSKINLVDLPDGPHEIHIKGKDLEHNDYSEKVNFFIDRSSFTITLLSPQEVAYAQNQVTIQYKSSKPLKRFWYTLNNGPEQSDLIIKNLSDGDYYLSFFGESFDGIIEKVTTQFTIASPVIDVQEPFSNRMYNKGDVKVTFNSNTFVTCELEYLNGQLYTGTTACVDTVFSPGENEFFLDVTDGNYVLYLTGIHEINQAVIQKTVYFAKNSTPPKIDVTSPENKMYLFNKKPIDNIPIEFLINKSFDIIMLSLDGISIGNQNALSNLQSGSHIFEIIAKDERYTNEKAYKRIDFSVAVLDIFSPQNNENIIPTNFPPTIDLKYISDTAFDNLIVSLNNEKSFPLDSSGSETLNVNYGWNDLVLTGSIGKAKFSKHTRFHVGMKNISVGPGSIQYDFNNCDSNMKCDVDISLLIQNTGDLDINEPFFVQFDHILANGQYDRKMYSIDNLSSGDQYKISIPTFQSTHGNTFHLIIDPEGEIIGEKSIDNSYKVKFMKGEITGINQSLSSDNVYLEGVSLFNSLLVNTTGQISRIEYLANEYIIINDNSEDGFFSGIIDMSLLTIDNPCTKIIAYDKFDNIIDSKSICYSLNYLALENYEALLFPWDEYISSSVINMNSIDISTFMKTYLDIVNDSFFKSIAILPDIDSEGNVSYFLYINTDLLDNQSSFETINFGDAVIVGGTKEIPKSSSVFIIKIDLKALTCSIVGGIPFIDGGIKYHENLNDIAKNLDMIIADEINGNLSLDKFIREFLFKGPFLSIFEKDFFVIIPYLFSAINKLSIKDPNIVSNTDIVLEYGFDVKKANVVIDDKKNVNLAIKSRLYADLLINTTLNISNGEIDYDLFITLPFSLPFISFRVEGNAYIIPQTIIVPQEFQFGCEIGLIDGRIHIGKLNTHYNISVEHSGRVAEADWEAGLDTILFGGAYGEEYKANLSINALAKCDLIIGEQPYSYSEYEYDLNVKKRHKYCLRVLFVKVCHKTPWYKSHKYSDYQSGKYGTYYSDNDIQEVLDKHELIDLGTIQTITSLVQYYQMIGDQQKLAECIKCQLIENALVKKLSHYSLYSDIAGKCVFESNPDMAEQSSFYADSECTEEIPYEPVSFIEYCVNNLVNNKDYVGNPNQWNNKSEYIYDSIGKSSKWTLSHGSQLDILSLPAKDNYRPFLKQIEYQNVGDCSLEMRVYKRNVFDDNLKPLLFVHGGGYIFRDLNIPEMEALIPHLTDRGYIVFAPFYRLLEDPDGSRNGPSDCINVNGEAVISDVEYALEWVKENGSLLGMKQDEKINIIGQSAGAHIAGWLSIHHSQDIRKAILFYPPTDLNYFVQESLNGIYSADDKFAWTKQIINNFFDVNNFSEIDLNSSFSLNNSFPEIVYQGQTHPPIFLMHGNKDSVVPIEMSTRLCDAIKKEDFGFTPNKGGEYCCDDNSKLIIIDGAEHAFDIRCFTKDVDSNLITILKKGLDFFENDFNYNIDELCRAGTSENDEVVIEAIQKALEWLEEPIH